MRFERTVFLSKSRIYGKNNNGKLLRVHSSSLTASSLVVVVSRTVIDRTTVRLLSLLVFTWKLQKLCVNSTKRNFIGLQISDFGNFSNTDKIPNIGQRINAPGKYCIYKHRCTWCLSKYYFWKRSLGKHY